VGIQPKGKVAGLIGAVLALAACSGSAESFAPPPRATNPVVFVDAPSSVAVELAVQLADLERALERKLPRDLWEIHQQDVACVPSKRLDLGLFNVKSPTIKCDIDGEVKRGKVRVSGEGRDLIVTLPVRATVRAHDIAGVLKGKTGTGAAAVQIRLQLDLAANWRLGGKAKLNYRWSQAPGIAFMGRRITFTSKADRELAPVRAQIEKTLVAQLAGVPVRAAAERGWRTAHTVLELNHANPEVWARVTPQRFRYGGYRIVGRQLVIGLGLDAMLEAKVGKEPALPTLTALPPLAPLAEPRGLAKLHLPVVADYEVLEPVIGKALTKRAKRPFLLGEYGSVTASFGAVEAYGTGRGRIAVGVPFTATTDLAVAPKASGTIWLTGRPINAPNSRSISFAEVATTGDTSLTGEKLLFALANAPEFQATIADALKQNFEGDFQKLLSKIDRAIARREDGPVVYGATIEGITTGVLETHGEGLYLPIDITARIKAEPVRLK